MSLPLPWVDRIFEKIAVVYGQQFLNRWRDIDLNTVKSDWCHELSGFEKNPNAIAYALANLPDTPPTVLQFKQLCLRSPSVDQQQLMPPRPDPKMVALIADGIREKVSKTEPKDYKQWARNILAHPEGKTRAQLDMAKRALAEV